MLKKVTWMGAACLIISFASVMAFGTSGANASDAHDEWKSLDKQSADNVISVPSDWKAPNILDGRNRPNALDGSNRINALDGSNRINALDGSNRINALDGRNRVSAFD